MALLQRVSDTFWSYLSPRKTDAQTETRIIKTASISRSLERRRSMSPASKISIWHVATTAPTQSVIISTAGQKRKRSRSTTTSPQHNIKAAKVRDVESAEDYDMDGDTVMDPDASEISDLLSHVHVAGASSSDRPSRPWDAEDDIDDTLVQAERSHYAKQFMPTPDSSLRSTPEILSQDWSPDALPLIRHLADRGYEPLLPTHWRLDFRYLPEQLFEPMPASHAYISSVRDHDFHATKALTALIGLGPRVRDKVTSRLPSEDVIEQHVRKYMQWALDDAELSGTTPVLVMQTGRAHVKVAVLQAGLRAKFEELGQRYLDVTLSPPTLYGLMASHTLVALLAYSPTHPHEGMRSIGMFDFGEAAYDVWNALALAILIMHCRSVAIDCVREGVVVKRDCRRGEGEEDLDA